MFSHLYFNFKKNVMVVDKRKMFYITHLQEGSWFGDFNIFLGLKSKYQYLASTHSTDSDERVMLMMCPAEKFMRICEEYPSVANWMLQRALLRRNML